MTDHTNDPANDEMNRDSDAAANDGIDDPHAPTPEFRASLEREIAREYRRGLLFADASRTSRGHKWGMAVGIAAGAVMALTVGLVLGASTGYASAEVIIRERGDTPLPPAAGLAVLRNIPPLMFSCASPPPVRAAQLPPQGVPVVDLPAAKTKTAMTLGGVLGVRQLSNGNLLVNDAGRRQLRLFDSTLTFQGIVRDSAAGSATSYGPRPVPIVRYLGDSTLLVDGQSGSLLVMDPAGQIARAMAPPHPKLLPRLGVDVGAVDNRGRILFELGLKDYSQGLAGGIPAMYSNPDSSVLVRVDPETRRLDTLARYKHWSGSMMIRNSGVTRFSMDPLPLIDDWALLSDGSIAVVRGHDYHVDWILPDGSTRSSPKLPFDWKRLTDEDKQKLIDSVRDVEGPKMALNLGQRRATPPSDAEPGRGGGRGSSIGVEMVQGPPVPVEYVPPKLSEMFDFSPSIRRGALMPDLDGNLWILPASSAQSKNGELVYDVVNAKGDFRRVRLPLGRSIAGFGKGGVVFLQSGDKTNGFYLEKTVLPSATRAAPR